MMLIPVLAASLQTAVPVAPPRDWAATTRTDVQAFHDLIAADHPGPYNRRDPDFSRRNDAALKLALRRAARTRDFAGYWWTLRGYVASFDDGHVQATTLQGSPLLTAAWPGFLTAFDGGGRQVVTTRADDAPVPLGAELLSCDGIAAARLAATNVGAFSGRWQLAAQRGLRGNRLFLDNGNPFIKRPALCRFRIARRSRAVALAWRPLVDPEWAQRLRESVPLSTPPIEARTLADGSRWYSISSFAGDPSGPVAKALNPMIAAMTTDRAAIVAAPRIVFDLRGNGGGSSQWSVDIAKAVWGGAAVAALPPDRSYVEWRASPANLATVAGYRDAWSAAPDASPEAVEWARQSSAGLAGALAARQPLWRPPDDPATPAATPPSPSTQRPRVYVLTDWRCASACLDAVDLWTALGSVPIGQETSADTLYMEVGDAKLPSGLVEVGIPMKVYRGRTRGSNVPVAPRYRYPGDMRDTAALERWAATLR